MKKFSKIIAIGVFILFLGSFGNFVGATTILYFGDSGNPISQNNTTVYLKSEEIYTVFDYTWKYKSSTYNYEDAIEDAVYIFRNRANASVEINITLPFYSEPRNINLTVNREPLNFTYGEINLSSYNYSYFNIKAINFTLKFEPLKEKKVNVKYIRNFIVYKTDETKVYCDYRYLAKTGKSWNHSIDYAKFTFAIPKEENFEFSDNTKYFEIEENSTHYILSIEYFDWNFDEDINVSWTITEKSEDEQSFMNTIAIVILIIIFIVAIIFAFGYRKNN